MNHLIAWRRVEKIRLFIIILVVIPALVFAKQDKGNPEDDLFPDGTLVDSWFKQTEPVEIDKLGKHFRITDYGVINDSTIIQTEKIQSIIDRASQTGGLIVIPRGVFLSGSLFFKPGTHLHVEEGGVLKGSDDISDFPIVETRMEGQTLKYFAALVNADGLDGFTISGKGTINGNGLRYWKSFWLRREVNPQCTNMDEMRPRLLYISNSKNVHISDVKLMNSPFWTTHLYKCEKVKLIGLSITSAVKPVKAPSTDAIDIDVCKDILVKNCYMSVNDDAIALKGGKGPLAHESKDNGGNYNIIIEDCTFSFCHSALTCGSESIHNRNIIFRCSVIDQTHRLFRLKMRPDTPQKYEYIRIEDISGSANSLIHIKPWAQFFDMKGEKEIPVSSAGNIILQNIKLTCDSAFDIEKSDQYNLFGFTFENMEINTKKQTIMEMNIIRDMVLKNVMINNKEYGKTF